MQTVRNHITLIGNMGADAQITNFDNGGKVARFNLATNKYSSKSREETGRMASNICLGEHGKVYRKLRRERKTISNPWQTC